jgi:hypothetical protein
MVEGAADGGAAPCSCDEAPGWLEVDVDDPPPPLQAVKQLSKLKATKAEQTRAAYVKSAMIHSCYLHVFTCMQDQGRPVSNMQWRSHAMKT